MDYLIHRRLVDLIKKENKVVNKKEILKKRFEKLGYKVEIQKEEVKVA